MKKIALLLTLVMVLGVGFSAMAADIKTSGKAWLNYEKESEKDEGVFTNGYRIQLDGTVDENSGFQIRYEGDGLLKRANYWTVFPGVGKLVAGKQNINYSVLDQLTTEPGPNKAVDGTGFLNKTFTGLSFAPDLGENFKVVGFVDLGAAAVDAVDPIAAVPDKYVLLSGDTEFVNNGTWWCPDWDYETGVYGTYVNVPHGTEVNNPSMVLLQSGSYEVPGKPGVSAEDQRTYGVEASYDCGFASVYGGWTKQKLNDKGVEQDPKTVVGVEARIVPDTLNLYAEYGANGADGDANDEVVVGGKLSAGGFDFFGEYAVDAEIYMLEAYKTINNVELNAIYFGGMGADNNESKFVLNTTLYF